MQACLLMIAIALSAACIFVVLHWWAEGVIDASEAVVTAFLFSMLVIGLVMARNLLELLMAALPLAVGLGYLLYSWKIGSWRAYYKRRCAEYEDLIRSDPKNLAARERLADAIYALGDLDRAIDEMQAAVDFGGDMECQYKLSKWSKERYLRDTTNPICRWCGEENQLNDRKCYKCGADLPYENAFTRWLIGGRSARARYYLLAITAVAIVIVSWLILGLLLALIPLIFCIVVIAGWSLISSART